MVDVAAAHACRLTAVQLLTFNPLGLAAQRIRQPRPSPSQNIQPCSSAAPAEPVPPVGRLWSPYSVFNIYRVVLNERERERTMAPAPTDGRAGKRGKFPGSLAVCTLRVESRLSDFNDL